jgi:hypothetical protein
MTVNTAKVTFRIEHAQDIGLDEIEIATEMPVEYIDRLRVGEFVVYDGLPYRVIANNYKPHRTIHYLDLSKPIGSLESHYIIHLTNKPI